MIEVRTSAGDTGYADSPEAAHLAARQLLTDAWHANPRQGYNPTATFYVAGTVVATADLRTLGCLHA